MRQGDFVAFPVLLGVPSCRYSAAPNLNTAYDPDTSAGSLAVEFVAPAVTSPALEDLDVAKLSERALYAMQPHLRFVDLNHRGYLLLDITSRPQREMDPSRTNRFNHLRQL